MHSLWPKLLASCQARACLVALTVLTAGVSWARFGVHGDLIPSALASEPLSLRYAAPAACPTTHDAQARFRARGLDAASKTRGARAEVEVGEKAGGGFHMRVVLVRGGVQTLRAFEGGDCDALLESALVVLAFGLGSDPVPAVGDAPAPTGAPTSSQPTPDRSVPGIGRSGNPAISSPSTPSHSAGSSPAPAASWKSSRVADSHPTRERARLALSPRVGVEWGTFPRPAATFGGALSYWFADRLGAAFSVGSMVPQTEAHPSYSGMGVVLHAVQFDLALCARGLLSTRRVSTRLCVGGRSDVYFARGFGSSSVDSKTAARVGAAGSLELAFWVVGPLSVTARVEGSIAPLRPSFVIEPFGSVFFPNLAAIRLGLGPEIRL